MHSHTSNSLLRFWITTAPISCNLCIRLASSVYFRLSFRAFFCCALVWGKGWTGLRCELFRARSELSMNWSALSNTLSARWSSVRSRGTGETSHMVETWGNQSGWTKSRKSLWLSPNILDSLLRRLSTWITNPCLSPTIVDSHQIQCATKICSVLLGPDMMFPKAYMIMSLSFFKVIDIAMLP